MFLETICIKNGKVQNLPAHIHRMRQTAEHFGFSAPRLPRLERIMPMHLRNTKVKCRVEYHQDIQHIHFEAYYPKVIRTLKLVEADDIDYLFKFSDREGLNNLNLRKGSCDEALIVKNGFITDTTYSNVVFQKDTVFFTPDTFLLNGIKRQRLLREGIIRETKITPDNLREYQHVYLINAMLDIEDGVGVGVCDIFS